MSYRLSSRAQRDLADIAEYSTRFFGGLQTTWYMGGLEFLFGLLGDSPRIGRMYSGQGGEIRCHPYRSHVVYYEVEADIVTILMVLHGRQMPPEPEDLM